MTNRKSHARFRLVPTSTTLDDLERPLRTPFQNTCVFGAQGKMLIKTVPHYQWRKCSSLTLVSCSIRLIGIFAMGGLIIMTHRVKDCMALHNICRQYTLMSVKRAPFVFAHNFDGHQQIFTTLADTFSNSGIYIAYNPPYAVSVTASPCKILITPWLCSPLH